MNILKNHLFQIIVSLLLLIIIFSFCKQQKKKEISSQLTHRDSIQTNVQELMLSNQNESDIEENINTLMKLIKEKEAELKEARQEMKVRSAELAIKEQQLTKIESEIKQFRTVSYFILVTGLVLIGIGLLLILKRNELRQKA